MAAPTIDQLLNLVPDDPSTVLARLEQHPSLASQRDVHGYSLLHAAASYGHLELARTLVQTYDVSIDVADEDGDTALFAVEDPAVARCLVEELGADTAWQNQEGVTPLQKMEDEGELPLVAAYLRSRVAGGSDADERNSNITQINATADETHTSRLPPLPDGVRIQMGTMEEPPSDGDAPDPEFRRRIEELAARDDFQSEEGQKELEEIVKDAISDLATEGRERQVRRRGS